MIGRRVAQNCFDHWDDEKLDVVDTEIEIWVSEDLPKVCASVRPVSVLNYCQIVISHLSREFSNVLTTDNCPLLCTNDLCWLVGSPSRAQRRLRTLSFPVLRVLLAPTSIRRPLKCGAPMLCMISTSANEPGRTFSQEF